MRNRVLSLIKMEASISNVVQEGSLQIFEASCSNISKSRPSTETNRQHVLQQDMRSVIYHAQAQVHSNQPAFEEGDISSRAISPSAEQSWREVHGTDLGTEFPRSEWQPDETATRCSCGGVFGVLFRKIGRAHV